MPMLDLSPSPPPQEVADRAPLSSVLPPLILGTATFNTQYVADPTRMPYTDIVRRALELGVPAFDTSPYYGPSEILLGEALHTLTSSPAQKQYKRDDYFLITKAGRIAGDQFDYSPRWIRYSVLRSLRRLHTSHLDLVYTHDVEFVSPAEVLAAVRELRRLRDAGLIRYVGISGYPVPVLCELAEMVRRETGEPLDAVMSYCHGSLQNGALAEGYAPLIPLGADGGDSSVSDDEDMRSTTSSDASRGSGTSYPLDRLRAAGVNVVLNASMLGMGLLTTRGVDNGPQAAWHPSPPALRQACAAVASATTAAGEKLERVAIRYALDTWSRAGATAGFGVSAPRDGGGLTVGASVMGVSSLPELEETWAVWQSVLDGLRPAANGLEEEISVDQAERTEAAVRRYEEVQDLVHNTLWPLLGPWRNHSWESGGPNFVNARRLEDMGSTPEDGIIETFEVRTREKPITAKKLDVVVKAVELTTV